MLKIKVTTGSLFVSGDTWGHRNAFKQMPATRWHKTAKAYHMPATVGGMRNLMALNVPLILDDNSKLLSDFVNTQNAVQEVKKHACTKDCPAWHHQGEALKFMHNQIAGVLNMPTGTGKTKTTIDLMVARNHQVILVITKKKAVSVWKKDCIKFLGTDAMNVVQLDTGNVAKNMKLAVEALEGRTDGKPVILVTNYQSVWRDPFKKWVLKQSIDLLVLDESHSIKSAGGKASIFMKSLRKRVASVVALTATFFGDKPVDIYGQMRTIDPCVYGTSFAAFKDMYCYMGGNSGKEILGYKNQDDMMQRIAPYIFQVNKEVLNLIPVRHKTYYTKLDPKTMALYRKFEATAFVALNDEQVMSADNVLVRLLKSQQLACGFIKPDGADDIIRVDTSKLNLLEEVLIDLPEMENVPAHTPVVVYYRFKEDLAGIKMLAAKLRYTACEISGDVDEQEKFKSGAANLLACQMQAGGTGVDGLQDVCHIGIYYSTDHSLVALTQSLGRLDRPGQMFSVLNIYLAAEGTVDEDIRKCHENKEDVITAFENRLKKIAEGENTVK